MAALAIKDTGEARVLQLSGRLDASTVRPVWNDARRALNEAANRRVVIDAANVDYCDGAGIALIVDMLRRRKDVEVANLKPAFAVEMEPLPASHHRPALIQQRRGSFDPVLAPGDIGLTHPQGI